MPCIIVDVTAQEGAEQSFADAVAQGHRVVLANKKPLCGSLESFRALTASGRTRYEATVGAGLPVISTLRSLLDTGDVIQQIAGCLSGTLGFLMTQLQDNVAFSTAVQTAKANGWTEPDPRDDLNGLDVARKALILARTSGFEFELQQVAVQSLYPESLASVEMDQFLAALPSLDEEYRERFNAVSQQESKTLRYVAHVSADQLKVGIADVLLSEPLGTLRGPDNLVMYHTQRYSERPLSVRGPGAGIDVTAAGVLSDMIAFAKEWR
jgi:homoserine dehydrogenase